ncbi:PorT family protein [Polaribacter sp. MSW13]|uniref:PorT family protein n=1 Tax=Polaribacter marinus TaxID=2916838 RepID=A0A9X1VQ73_9FLAO|nr:porin family protein [Polaribacter marinus]MCI2228670.1 PorT family protein [Polaribacter marinus]
MNKVLSFTFSIFCASIMYAQKDSLHLGDRYAEDQIYASISYAQFFNQPQEITKSDFSYAISVGFIKDIILNKSGTVSIAGGVGYGFDFFNHELKVEEINNKTVFSSDNTISNNVFKAHNLEFPLELRWRTSNVNKYSFWRIYTGIKFLYNVSNKFEFEHNAIDYSYKNISDFNKLQYGLTLSAGYDEFNINVFYGLTPIFKNGNINGENINTKVLKFGLIFYIL